MKELIKIDVYSPINGVVKPLTYVDDPMFKEEMLGLTICIDPEESMVYAPFDGTISVMYPSGHAVGIVREDGLEVLIHVGIDTVALNGYGFQAQVKQGDRVEKHTALLAFDKGLIQAQGYSSETFIVFTNDKKFEIKKLGKEKVKVKDVLCYAEEL